MFILSLHMLTAGIALRAFSSVGRASPLQGEGQKFESSNAHHKKGSDFCYFLFYLEVLITRTSVEVRATCEQSAECFCFVARLAQKAKHEDTFNANRSRQSSNAHHKKRIGFFLASFYFELCRVTNF